jgi:hypothetical protein
MKTTTTRVPAGPRREPREVFRQYLKMRDDSEHCHGCRRPYCHGEFSTVGYDADRRLIMVGECCVGRLISAIATSFYYAPDLPMPRA